MGVITKESETTSNVSRMLKGMRIYPTWLATSLPFMVSEMMAEETTHGLRIKDSLLFKSVAVDCQSAHLSQFLLPQVPWDQGRWDPMDACTINSVIARQET